MNKQGSKIDIPYFCSPVIKNPSVPKHEERDQISHRVNAEKDDSSLGTELLPMALFIFCSSVLSVLFFGVLTHYWGAQYDSLGSIEKVTVFMIGVMTVLGASYGLKWLVTRVLR